MHMPDLFAHWSLLYGRGLNAGSRMSGVVHVRFWERAEVKVLRATLLPLYRRSAMFLRDAREEISRVTMSEWMMRVGDLLAPIVVAVGR